MEENNSKKYKIGIIGSRTYTNYDEMHQYLDTKLDKIEMIISGGCKGADEGGRIYAQKRGLPCLIFYPKWRDKDNNFWKGAGFARDAEIVKASDLIISYWDGQSRGTKHTMDLAEKYGKKIIIHYFKPEEQIEQLKEKEISEPTTKEESEF